MKKFVTAEILKKLMFPALVVLLVPSCSTFPYHGKEAQPYIKESVRFVNDLRFDKKADWLDKEAVKVIEFRNPLDLAVKITYSCDHSYEEDQVMLLPPHTWGQAIHFTTANLMYTHDCFITKIEPQKKEVK